MVAAGDAYAAANASADGMPRVQLLLLLQFLHVACCLMLVFVCFCLPTVLRMLSATSCLSFPAVYYLVFALPFSPSLLASFCFTFFPFRFFSPFLALCLPFVYFGISPCCLLRYRSLLSAYGFSLIFCVLNFCLGSVFCLLSRGHNLPVTDSSRLFTAEHVATCCCC